MSDPSGTHSVGVAISASRHWRWLPSAATSRKRPPRRHHCPINRLPLSRNRTSENSLSLLRRRKMPSNCNFPDWSGRLVTFDHTTNTQLGARLANQWSSRRRAYPPSIRWHHAPGEAPPQVYRRLRLAVFLADRSCRPSGRWVPLTSIAQNPRQRHSVRSVLTRKSLGQSLPMPLLLRLYYRFI